MRRRPGSTAIGLDTAVPMGFARDKLQPRLPVQGNLDPVLLVVGGAALEHAVRTSGRRSGAGRLSSISGMASLPETPPENVAALARLLAEPTR